jgi:hypothetical protein
LLIAVFRKSRDVTLLNQGKRLRDKVSPFAMHVVIADESIFRGGYEENAKYAVINIVGIDFGAYERNHEPGTRKSRNVPSLT